MPDQDAPLGEAELHGVTLPLEVVPVPAAAAKAQTTQAQLDALDQTYSPERQRDWVRLIVTCGFLLILGYIVVFATVEATSYPAHWQQTKELLQILLPALTGIIGTVIGFYFGTQASSRSTRDDG